MKLGSHNTFTYLPVRQWYVRPFAFTAKCQEVDLWLQYSLGTRLFDIRVRFDKFNYPILCHGIFSYLHSKDYIYEMLNKLNKCKGIYIRIVLELKKSNSDKYKRQRQLFLEFCNKIQQDYSNIIFFGGKDRTGFSSGEIIYDFNNKVILHDRYSSTTSLFKSNSKFLRIIDDLYPKYYAKTHNVENIKEFKDSHLNDRWLFIDFVNIK